MQHQGMQCGEKPSPYSDALSKKEAPAAFHKDGQTLCWPCIAFLLNWEQFSYAFFALSHLPCLQLPGQSGSVVPNGSSHGQNRKKEQEKKIVRNEIVQN